MSRSDKGPVVHRGRIRVDARRAVAQLRAHLLVDLHAWPLEILRAAVMGGATRIDIRHDADDLWIAFDGAPFAAASLSRLLDDVLADAETEEARRRRLLAIGVNAALGLGPARVDLYTKAPGGRSAELVRWTPASLDAEAAVPAPQNAEAPEGSSFATTLVHARAKAGWQVVKSAALGSARPEIALITARTHDLDVPLTLADEPFPRSPRAEALLRVPFTAIGLARAWLEIVAAPRGAPETLILERGVVLARYGWLPPDGFPSASLLGLHLPVRVVADAPTLPTNASRSTVREDAPVLGAIARGSGEAFLEAVDALEAIVAGRPPPADAVVLSGDRARLDEALGAITALVNAAHVRGVATSERARALATLPLLRNACGAPLSLAEVAGATPAHPAPIWRGKVPVEAELLPWMKGVVWQRGGALEAALADVPTRDAAAIVELARAALARRTQWLAHPQTAASVGDDPAYVARTAFEVTEGELLGLGGEVALLAAGEGGEPSTFRIHVEGRVLDAFTIDRGVLPLRIAAALAWEGRFQARYDFGGVERGALLARAVLHAARVGALLADDLARGPRRDAVAPVLRAAVGAASVTAGRLGLAVERDLELAARLRGLWTAPIWRASEPPGAVSLEAIAGRASITGAVCFAPPGSKGRALDHRNVVLASGEELSWILAAVQKPGRSVQTVPYDGGLFDERARALAMQRRHRAPSPDVGPRWRFEERGVRGECAVTSEASKLLRIHAGRVLGTSDHSPRYGPVAIAVEHDGTVPSPQWDRPLWPSFLPGMGTYERELLIRIVASCEGDATAIASLEGFSAEAPPVDYVLRSASAIRERLARAAKPPPEETSLLQRIEALPLLAILDARGTPYPASLADVLRIHPSGSVPVLAEPPGFATFDWQAVLVPSAMNGVLDQWLGGRLSRAEGELDDRRRRAEIEGARAVLFGRPEEDVRAVGPLGDPSLPHAEITLSRLAGDRSTTEPTAATAAFLLAPPPAPEGPIVDVLFHRRPLLRNVLDEGLPIVVRVGLSRPAYINKWSELSRAGNTEIARAVTESAVALATIAAGPDLFRIPRALDLVAAVLRRTAGGPAVEPIRQALRGASVRWPTVQGSEATLAELARSGEALYVGSRRFDAWLEDNGRGRRRTRSELDAPVLYVAPGEIGDRTRALAMGLGFAIKDVTGAIGRLQAARAATGAEAPTVLPGAAAHADLRAALTSLGVHTAVGELELTQGPLTEITVADLHGIRRLERELPVPFRAIAKVDEVDTSEVADARLVRVLSGAARRHLRTLVPCMDALPAWVREHARAMVCEAVRASGKAPKADASAPVFTDTTGRHHTLEDLLASKDAHRPFTTAPPPYPAHAYDPFVLVLTASLAAALGKVTPLREMTSVLARHLEGERRAAAPRRTVVALDPERRAQCLHGMPVAGALEGEVGLLSAMHHASRGIEVLSQGRPLATLDDGGGWPIVASVNGEALVPNRAFDGLETVHAADAIRRDVRKAADQALRAWLAPPPDALAVHHIDSSSTSAGALSGLVVCGTLWLPPAWPRAPVVRFPSGQRTLSIVGRRGTGVVPIEGFLLVMPRPPRTTLGPVEQVGIALMARTLAVSMLHEVAGRRSASPEVIEAYAWDLALTGAAPVTRLVTPTSTGTSVDAGAVCAELERMSTLWWTGRRGDIEGRFPANAPPFVLLGEGVAFEVLRARLPPEALSELGGEASPVLPLPELAVDLGAPDRETVPLLLPPDAVPPPSAPPRPSWFSGLVRRAVELVVPRVDPAAEDDPLARALLGGLSSLALATGPVLEIGVSDRGRPLRYEARARRLVVHRNHPAIRALAARIDEPGARAVLVASAVSEINRALEGVTDAEERRAIETLLSGV